MDNDKVIDLTSSPSTESSHTDDIPLTELLYNDL